MVANHVPIIYIYMEQSYTPHNNGERQTSPVEIERKFALASLDDIPNSLPIIGERKLTQAYLEITDEREVRVRKTEEDGQISYELTVKTKLDDDANGLARGEVTEVITEEQFNQAVRRRIGNAIEKTRLTFALDGNELEVDVYEGALTGLLSAEIEFDSKEASEQFKVPSWLGQEVTGMKAFKNQQLALNGIPKSYLNCIKYLEK